MKANTIIDKMDEIERKYPAELHWHLLRKLLMAVAQAEKEIEPAIPNAVYCNCQPNQCQIITTGTGDWCLSCNLPRR